MATPCCALVHVASFFALQACATVANPDPRDPMESWNRGVFGFNDTVDATRPKVGGFIKNPNAELMGGFAASECWLEA